MQWVWEEDGITTEFTTSLADNVVEALDTDEFRRTDGNRYSEGSKRKILDVLTNWFDFKDVDWEPDINFSDEEASEQPDPFSKKELRLLWQAALEYKSVKSYNNVTREERDRIKAYLAQELGKPKTEIGPSDWEKLNNDWKIPSLIRTEREAGWRPDLIARMEVDWYDSDEQVISIPAGEAPKNDADWEHSLSDEAAFSLDQWLEQRACLELYDGRDEIWLNREGNPYDSASLNNLLDNLMEEAAIEPRGRKLVWYSFRHSIGTYIFAEYKSLKMVAEMLRQKSRKSAEHYVHTPPETKQEAAEVM